MSSERENDADHPVESAQEAEAADQPSTTPPRGTPFPLPGLAAIALYLLVLSGFCIVGVVKRDIRPVYLIFAAAFISASMGLLLLFRWAWTLALAAVVLLVGLFLWRFSTQHDLPSIVQGLLNLVIFLYLVRPEVRSQLR